MSINLKQGRALVVVAHPDDETIWMGGTILKHSGVSWTIYSLSRARDKDRAIRFKRVSKMLHARGVISNLKDDDDRISIKRLSKEAENLILKIIAKNNFDYIFTHNEDGDYGNKRHQAVYMAVRNLLKTEKLKSGNTFYFAYEMHKSDKYAIPRKKTDFESKLSTSIFNKKMKIIQDIYGFSPNSFEYKSCSKVEKFNLII